MKNATKKLLTGLSVLFLLPLLVHSCQFPHDPEKSWEKAKTNSLRVGIVDNPPYAEYKNGHPTGKEITLLTNFASQNNLTVEYFHGSESDLIKKLTDYQLDVLVGGFDKKTVWEQKASPTITYDEKHVLLIPNGENRLLYHLEQFIFENRGNS
jgi:membrane-bound lytic murein transglycosylase MltF